MPLSIESESANLGACRVVDTSHLRRCGEGNKGLGAPQLPRRAKLFLFGAFPFFKNRSSQKNSTVARGGTADRKEKQPNSTSLKIHKKTVFEVTEAGGGKVTDERKLDDIRRVR